jgi:hypothetical protein
MGDEMDDLLDVVLVGAARDLFRLPNPSRHILGH